MSSVFFDQPTKIYTDGGVRKSKYSGHNLWQEEQNPSILPVMAEIKDFQVRRGKDLITPQSLSEVLLYGMHYKSEVKLEVVP